MTHENQTQAKDRIYVNMSSRTGKSLRSRLSALAKAQGGEDAPARILRNKLAKDGLTITEYNQAVEMLACSEY